MGAYGNTSEAETKYGLHIDGWNLVRSTRISRTMFQYAYTLTVRNASGQDAAGVVMDLLHVPAGLQILDPLVTVGLVPAGGSVMTQDTFTIQADRTTSASAGISWQATTSGSPPVKPSARATPVPSPGSTGSASSAAPPSSPR